MDRNATIEAYLNNRLTADDVERGTGLSERSQRELLKAGVIEAIPQARTKQRLLGAAMFRRATVVACLNQCGLSLTVAGQIAYAMPQSESIIEDSLRHIEHIIFGVEEDKQPFIWKIEIIDSKYVTLNMGDGHILEYGELSAGMTSFTFWMWRIGKTGEYSPPRDTGEFRPQFNSVKIDDIDIDEVVADRRKPVTKITVDVVQAIRRATTRLIDGTQ